jgi:hypothetical protein
MTTEAAENQIHEAKKHFRNKEKDYLKEKINELAMNSKQRER